MFLKAGSLWSRVLERTARALQCGALHAIPTDCTLVEQDGVHFLVRLAPSLEAKAEQRKKVSGQECPPNPFLPYDEELFVADISDTHVCLLNKFNVVDYHILIVTRSFEEQESLLTLDDFHATWACLAEFDGLAFYNAGTIAGASQRHKHLQMVPLPLSPRGPKVPIDPLLAAATFGGTVGVAPGLPFVHAIARVDPGWVEFPLEGAEASLECYRAMIVSVGLREGREGSEGKPLGPYNLLVTREWMWLVPRSKECFGSISVNALGFAGALLVKNQQALKFLEDQGPMTILREVAVPHGLSQSPFPGS